MAEYLEMLKVAQQLGIPEDKRADFVMSELEKQRQIQKEERERKIQREREDKEREARLAEIKAQREKEKEEREAEREARLAERNAQKEIEELRTRTQKEIEQIKLETARIQAENTIPEGANREHQNNYKPKFRDFKENSENITSYLIQFEGICKSYKYSEDLWANILLSKLSGKCLNIISSLTDAQKKDYGFIKNALLKYFGKTEDDYRRMFHNIRIDRDTDPHNTLFHIRDSLNKWLELTEINVNDPKALIDIFIVDKVLRNSSEPLFTFLKERKIRTEKDLVEAISTFKDAHPNEILDKRPVVVASMINKDSKPWNNNHGQRNKRYISLPSRWQNNNNKPEMNYSFHFNCFYCGIKGHKKSQCRKLLKDSSRGNNYGQTQYRYSPNSSPNRRNNHRGSYNFDRHRPRQRDFQSFPHRQQNYNPRQSNNVTKETLATACHTEGKLEFFPAYVNNKLVQCLRDTGCTTIVINKNLVDESNYTNETTNVSLANHMEIKCRKAIIQIDCPWITGQVKATVMDNPICPLIIGNYPGVPNNSQQLFMQWMANRGLNIDTINAVVTRQQEEKQKEETIQIEDKVDQDKPLTLEDLIQMQNEDEEIQKIKDKIKTRNTTYRGHQYYLHNSLLVRKYQHGEINRSQIVIPKILRKTIIQSAHDSPLAGHMGIKKTLERILQNFFWPGIHKDLKTYIGQCKPCLTKNPIHGKHKAPIQATDKLGRNFEKVAIDIIGPISTISQKGHRFILTLIDMASRWPEAIPLKTLTQKQSVWHYWTYSQSMASQTKCYRIMENNSPPI